jgi:phosphoenolpyruvate carboxylase
VLSQPSQHIQKESNVTSSGSARNARPRRNAASPAASGGASSVTSLAAKSAKAPKAAVPLKKPAASAKTKTPDPMNGKTAKAGRTREDKDLPLFEDIRYLGRLLGDVVREQEGDKVFDVVETIRQTAVKFRREDDSEALQTLEKRLRSLSPEQTVSVVRAFSYFSHLANIAEDRHHNRRRRIHALAGSAPQAGTMAYAIDRLKQSPNATKAKATLQKFFHDALIVPVLTAHPTEVSRKSILDAQHEVARLLAERDQDLTTRERAHNEAMLRASPMKSRTRCRITTPRSSRKSPRCTPISKPRSPSTACPRVCLRSCRWEAGLAAIATAIRTSPRPP